MGLDKKSLELLFHMEFNYRHDTVTRYQHTPRIVNISLAANIFKSYNKDLKTKFNLSASSAIEVLKFITNIVPSLYVTDTRIWVSKFNTFLIRRETFKIVSEDKIFINLMKEDIREFIKNNSAY